MPQGDGFPSGSGARPIIDFANIAVLNLPSPALGDTAPASPNAKDAEFDSSTDIAAFTQVNYSTSQATIPSDAPSWLSFIVPASSNSVRGLVKTVNSAADWSITMKINCARDFGGNTIGGIQITDNVGTGIIYGFGDGVSGYSLLTAFNLTTFNVGGALAAYSVHAGNVINYLRVTYTQSTNKLNFYYSPDGYVWSLFYIDQTPAVTITRAGLGLRQQSARTLQCLVDFIRYTGI